jgi:predicted dehydrogenase
MIAAAERNGVVLRIGTHQRFRPVYGDIKAAVDAGELGRIGHIRLSFYIPFPKHVIEGNWRQTIAGSGGVWAAKEFGAHLLDLLNWWTGGPLDVVGAVLGTIDHDVETDDTATMLLRLDGGGSAVVSISAALKGYTHEVALYGTEGWLLGRDVWRGGGFVERGAAEDVPWVSASERIGYTPGELLDPYYAQLSDMASAVAGGPSIAADGAAGLAVLEAVETAVELSTAR